MNTIDPTIRMHHATRAKAERLMQMFEAEYPRLTLVAIEGEPVDHPKFRHELEAFLVKLDKTDILMESKQVPELADIIDVCAEQEIDPSGEEQPRATGSIVREGYRQNYREASTTGQSCGDWLAERLAADTLDGEGKLDLEAFLSVLNNNKVDMTGKWARALETQTAGWRGRFRMSGRIVLEKQIALTGEYRDPRGVKITPHSDWLEGVRSKHAKYIAKQQAVAAEAQAA